MADTITTYDRNYTTTDLDDDDIQHGIDDNPSGDAEKGATLGGVGGAVVGAVAGSMAGPLGAVAGAVIGGLAGGVASGAAVGAIDRHDNDDTVSGLGTVPDRDLNDTTYRATDVDNTYTTTAADPVVYDTNTVGGTIRNDYDTVKNDVRADYDNATYGTRAAANSGIGTGISRETEVGETRPSFKTGGVANDGTPDTRGLAEKTADAITGDDVDDKTGRVVDHP